MNSVNRYVKSPDGNVYRVQANGVPEIVTDASTLKSNTPRTFLTDAMQARISTLSYASANHGVF